MARSSKPEYEVVKDGEVLQRTNDRDYALQLVSGLNGAELREVGTEAEKADAE
jgi:hypothetical protein